MREIFSSMPRCTVFATEGHFASKANDPVLAAQTAVKYVSKSLFLPESENETCIKPKKSPDLCPDLVCR